MRFARKLDCQQELKSQQSNRKSICLLLLKQGQRFWQQSKSSFRRCASNPQRNKAMKSSNNLKAKQTQQRHHKNHNGCFQQRPTQSFISTKTRWQRQCTLLFSTSHQRSFSITAFPTTPTSSFNFNMTMHRTSASTWPNGKKTKKEGLVWCHSKHYWQDCPWDLRRHVSEKHSGTLWKKTRWLWILSRNHWTSRLVIRLP